MYCVCVYFFYYCENNEDTRLFFLKREDKKCDWNTKWVVQYIEKVLWIIECFKSGHFSLNDAAWSGRRVEVDRDIIKVVHENCQRYTTRVIANIIWLSESRDDYHFHQFGYFNHFIMCLSHNLSNKKS